jgi:hypothetical protein
VSKSLEPNGWRQNNFIKTMNCEFAEKVSEYIDGELPSDQVLAVERHLLACGECQELRSDFMSMRSEISNYPLRPISQLQPRLAQLVSPATASWADRLVAAFGAFTTQWRRPLLAGALAVLLLVLGLAIWLSRSPQKENLVAKDERKTESSKSQATPSPAVSPEQKEQPRNGTQKFDEPALVPPKFRLREAVTGLQPKRQPALPKSEDVLEPDSENIATNLSTRVGPADTETMTAQHVEQSELLLRSFRNLRPQAKAGEELGHERRRAQRLFYQNVMLRREADSSGDVEVATLLQSLEPILLDIANLPQDAPGSEVRAIKDRVERQNLVALLQINARPQLR